MSKDRPVYIVVLRALPSPYLPPAICRLKAFLKRAKRDWLLVCIECRQTETTKQKDS